MNMRYYFVLFIIYLVSINFYFYNQYSKKIDFLHESKINLIKNSFSASINTFALANDNFHSAQSDTISRLVNEANGKSIEERDIVREKILNKFMTFYSDKKLDSFNGMHFFDERGYSLLRFHKLKKHEDKIIEKRFSLQNMNKNFIYQEGLELGVYKESFRFQYPLFYDGKFVGSYEYSIDFDAIMREMKKFYGDQCILLFKSKSIEKIVDMEVVSDYFKEMNLKNSSFYYRKDLQQDRFRLDHLKYLFSNTDLEERIVRDTPSTIDYTYNYKESSLVVIPVYDIEKKHIAYMLTSVKDEESTDVLHTLIVETLLASILSFFIYLFVIKQIKNRAYVRDLVNIQHDMLIVTDGQNIKDANKAFLQFFRYEKLSDFMTDYGCVCDFFIVESGFLQKENKGLDWLTYVKRNPEERHQVKMLDRNTSETKIFELESEVLKNTGHSFVLFRDITKLTEEKKLLEERANYDGLTAIYNRNRFEHFLDIEIEKSTRYGDIFSLIMFDIDHFKEVNDTYGHAIGDIILKEITALVRADIRDIDIFARWGGEEFMIISNIPLEKATIFAEKLRFTISNYKFTRVDDVSCSFGVTQYRENDTRSTIVKRCDERLYEAKSSGRNCVISLA